MTKLNQNKYAQFAMFHSLDGPCWCWENLLWGDKTVEKPRGNLNKKIWMLLLLNSKPCALSGLTKQRTIYKIMKDIDCIWGQIACDSKLSIIKKIWSSFNKLKNPPSFHHFNPKLCWLFLQQWDVPVPYICRNPPWVPCKHEIIIYICNI